MNQQQPTSTNSPRTLLAAAALIAVVGVGVTLGAVASADTNTDSTTDELSTAEYRTVPTGTEAPTTAVEIAASPAPLPSITPEALRGIWREVDGTPITADDCRPELPTNFGQILTISESGFVFFESGGELIEVHDVAATRIEATYDTTYADTPTQDRITFDAPGDATVLIMSGDDRPGPTQYVRCPDHDAAPAPSMQASS